MRGRYDRRPMPVGGYFFFIICIGIGTVAGAPDNREAERARAEECAPMMWHAGRTDAEAWNMLIEQGYQPVTIANGAGLVPPRCEGETP